MEAAKKTDKAMSEDLGDFLNGSQFLKNSPQTKKTQKRQPISDNTDEEDIGEYPQAKMKKLEKISRDHQESRQKLLKSIGQLMEARKQGTNNLLSGLLDLIQQQDADDNILAKNEKKLEHMVGVFNAVGAILKCIQQSSDVASENVKALIDIYDAFKKRDMFDPFKDTDEMESKQKTETENHADLLEEDMNELQQKIITETKREQLENLQKIVFHAYHLFF